MNNSQKISILIFLSFSIFFWFMSSNTPSVIYKKNYSEYQDTIAIASKLLDDITINENQYILDEVKKPTHLYGISKLYDNPDDKLRTQIQRNINATKIWKKSSFSIRYNLVYCYDEFSLNIAEYEHAESFRYDPRLRLSVSISWNEHGHEECMVTLE